MDRRYQPDYHLKIIQFLNLLSKIIRQKWKGKAAREGRPTRNYIFSSSRVLATAAADFCSMSSSSLVSFRVMIFSMPHPQHVGG
ncbi:MAG: hypothetical protein M1438_12040, partial [Deltaproteobacteria bacterium]|nr:hypothetical protein [Deltaproteobacteria bacterium]